MTTPIQSLNRLEIRQAIGYNLGLIIVREASTTGDTTSLIDTYGLARGGDKEYVGRQVMINAPVGSIVAKEKSFVSAFSASSSDATLAPAFTASIIGGDTYEMWKIVTIEEVNDMINQAMLKATANMLVEKETLDTFTNLNDFEYDVLSGFKALYSVDYARTIRVLFTLSLCETAWTAGSVNVTVTADTAFVREGKHSAKLVEDGNSAAGAILGYDTISSIDISECDRIEFDMYSSIALTAGQIDFALDNTAAIASPIESLDVPAMDAGVWYRHSLALANPHLDTAIISLGLVQTSDVGAATYYVDNILAVKRGSKEFVRLSPEQWDIVKGSTNYLRLTTGGKAATSYPTQLRLNGYALPALLSDDTTDSEIDPEYIIAYCTGSLLIGHARSAQIDTERKAEKAKYWLGIAEQRLSKMSTDYENDVRSV